MIAARQALDRWRYFDIESVNNSIRTVSQAHVALVDIADAAANNSQINRAAGINQPQAIYHRRQRSLYVSLDDDVKLFAVVLLSHHFQQIGASDVSAGGLPFCFNFSLLYLGASNLLILHHGKDIAKLRQFFESSNRYWR